MQISSEDKRITLRFLIVGLVGFLTNYSVLKIVIIYAGLGKIQAEIIAAIIALQVTFLLHDRWTYRNETSEYNIGIWARYLAYLVSNSFGSFATVVLFSIFSYFAPDLIALGLAAIIAMAWNFFINKLLIWRNHNK